MECRKAFTLIELLVVISIIAILMAVMMPVLGKSKDRANRLLCISNIRQCYNAGYLYASDFDDYLPMGNIWADQSMPEGWTDMNFNTCLILYQSYALTPEIGMCTSWKRWKDEFFNVPSKYDEEHFKLGGTLVGYIYYGRRYDKDGTDYSPKLENGTVYKTPVKASDGGKHITSNTVMACFHWDTVSTGGSWGAKMPHIQNGIGQIYQSGADKLEPKPEGLCISKLDGSGGWTKFKNLEPVTQGKVRFYFSK
jgi:prepilin-type N-terminal cleavage/methylation domain-containing protein